MSKFYTQISLLTILCGGALFISDKLAFTHIGWIGYIALLFFALLTTILTNFSIHHKPKNNSRFVTGILGSTGLRMFLCIVFIFIYWLKTSERDMYFVLYFFILYLFYTMFEINFIVHKLRADKKNGI